MLARVLSGQAVRVELPTDSAEAGGGEAAPPRTVEVRVTSEQTVASLLSVVGRLWAERADGSEAVVRCHDIAAIWVAFFRECQQ